MVAMCQDDLAGTSKEVNAVVKSRTRALAGNTFIRLATRDRQCENRELNHDASTEHRALSSEVEFQKEVPVDTRHGVHMVP